MVGVEPFNGSRGLLPYKRGCLVEYVQSIIWAALSVLVCYQLLKGPKERGDRGTDNPGSGSQGGDHA